MTSLYGTRLLPRGLTGCLVALVAVLAISTPSAFAQDKAKSEPETPAVVEKPAPYDDDLARLAEILGSLHYLRNLCDSDDEPQWRSSMQTLLDSETANEPGRKARMTAAFNRGYRAFAALHVTCTAAALDAEAQYRAEGATLAREITARYGN
ncbi:TIGR02301 family protein [Rhizobium halophytocola]|uniref:Uncharacterized protein (TIGR02301 family) n=1 Tax=Rhizobium halophytocola TaxID=735519 RepID=A0ABS4DYQ0_9HYPH|nr:TIGR02301 family protein [Rhizobium halophytocola]MBP1850815.1 uncharacterized protein (TIGR02301 family) [Rhizobium halophytocola]